MLFLLVAASVIKRNEEYQPILTSDFPHLLGIERVKAWMDDQVDPCTDFYKYSCGGFEERYKDYKNIDILKLMGQSNALLMKQIIEQQTDTLSHTPVERDIFYKAKDYYQSCVNKDAIQARGFEPVKVLGYDVLDYCQDWHTFPALVGHFQSQGVQLFFRPMYTKVQFQDPNDLRLQLLPANAYQVEKKTIRKVFEFYQSNGILSQDEDLDFVTAYVHDLEQNMVHKKAYRQHGKEQYTTIHQLSRTTGLDWEQYKRPMRLDQVEKVYLWGDAQEWKLALRFFGHQNKELLQYYVLWRVATSHFNKLSDDYFNLWHYDIYPNAVKADYDEMNKDPELFQQDCIKEMGVHLTYLSGHLFVKYAFNETQKHEAAKMINHLMDTFEDRLKTIEWMDHESKSEALEKLGNMINTVGYPDWLKDPYLVASYHRPLKFKPNHYFENAVQAELYSTLIPWIHQMRKHHLDRVNTYYGSPWQLNAFHLSDMVQIQINSGILQRPLFSSSNPEAMNFGSLGMIIGHEITHGFDSSGFRLDARGVKREWMSSASRNEFMQRTQCFLDQYSEAQVKLSTGEEFHPKPQTIGENMADNGGLHTAYDAWLRTGEQPEDKMDKFTKEQLFFMAFGQTWCAVRDDSTIKFLLEKDVHSPNPIRVNEAVRNHPGFQKAFKCSKESKMVRPESQICRLY
ncbi:hypothetical protein EDD86DRAFT_247697 [Gorgonomyces haynaldii]|nr:hypothetical protein EDD86DRAFT_247697 [Gorgonomyces haynaldii]